MENHLIPRLRTNLEDGRNILVILTINEDKVRFSVHLETDIQKFKQEPESEYFKTKFEARNDVFKILEDLKLEATTKTSTDTRFCGYKVGNASLSEHLFVLKSWLDTLV